MVDSRDIRKTKFTGFFVNSGAIERIGEKAAPVRRRAVAKKKLPEGAAAGAENKKVCCAAFLVSAATL